MMKNRQGAALPMVLVVILLIVGLATAFASVSMAYLKSAHDRGESAVAQYAAEAGLELVWQGLITADDAGEWIALNSAAPPEGETAIEDLPIAGMRVTVKVFALGPNLYRAESTAFHPEDGRMTRDGEGRLIARRKATTVAQEFRPKTSFAQFMFFSNESLNFGTSKVRGQVHTNRSINLYEGNAEFFDRVTCVKKVAFKGADAEERQQVKETTRFHTSLEEGADPVRIPEDDILALENVAGPGYRFGGGAGTTLLLDGDYIVVTEGGVTNRIPAPADGVIYVDGDVKVSGKTSSRYTVAASGKVSITGRITYVDREGDPAYVLQLNGATVPGNETRRGVAWLEADGYTYVFNETGFDMPAEAMPTLGLIAVGSIEVAGDAPYNMEVHAAMLSAKGSISCSLATAKGNLRVMGSNVGKKAGWRYQAAGNAEGYVGWGLSGGYLYDEGLMENPPPSYLLANQPQKGPRWKMTPGEVTRVVGE